MKKILAVILILLASILGIGLFGNRSMHKESSHGEHISKQQKYHCPMHPNYISDKPGECPICHMRLVLIDEEPTSSDEHSGSMEEKENASVLGQGAFTLSPEREQLIGVKTEEVVIRDLSRKVRAFAQVAYDPDLYSAVTEYQAALQARRKGESNVLIDAAILKLRQLGLSKAQIEKIKADDASPIQLILTEKGKSVWIYIQVYEYESGLVHPGQSVEVTSPAFRGKKFFGTVQSVNPILSEETRSLKVRAEVENPDGLLKPQMYVDAKIEVNLGKKVSIPQNSILNTGERQIAFVRKEKGKYEPRELTLGEEAEEYVEVLKGVSPGEQIVSSANFLIDSESKLKAALSSPSHQH